MFQTHDSSEISEPPRPLSEIDQLLTSLPLILICIGPDDRIKHWNSIAEKIFHIRAEDILGKFILTTGIEWDWDEILFRVMEPQLAQPRHMNDVKYRSRDGHEGFLDITVSPVPSASSGYNGYVILGSEVTQRRTLELQLAQSQKLEAIGQLAAGIAHEINTPIQYIGDNTRFIQDSVTDLLSAMSQVNAFLQQAPGEASMSQAMINLKQTIDAADLDYLVGEIPAALEQTLHGVKRVAEIVRAMKEFSHPGVKEKTPTDINHALENTITVSRNEWKYVAEMVTNLEPDLPLVPCLPGELNQVFLNMIVNAAHAIADGPEEDNADKGVIEISTKRAGNQVCIKISDTGPGIPAEIKDKIFDPFFTTKEPGRGTGQGLAIAHQVIVEKHGGSISCDSRDTKGTSFTIALPVEGGIS